MLVNPRDYLSEQEIQANEEALEKRDEVMEGRLRLISPANQPTERLKKQDQLEREAEAQGYLFMQEIGTEEQDQLHQFVSEKLAPLTLLGVSADWEDAEHCLYDYQFRVIVRIDDQNQLVIRFLRGWRMSAVAYIHQQRTEESSEEYEEKIITFADRQIAYLFLIRYLHAHEALIREAVDRVFGIVHEAHAAL